MSNWPRAGVDLATVAVAGAACWRGYRRDPEGFRTHFGERVHPAVFLGAVAIAILVATWLVLLLV
jgi:hypothetical protein